MGAEARRRHQGAVAAASLLATAAVWALGAPPVGVQVAVLAVAVLGLGVPHGALDHRPARRLLVGAWGRAWWLPFLAGYLALAGLVFAAFLLSPQATLFAFLLLSIVHFGLDAPASERTPAGVVTWGAPAIVMPAAFHPEETARLFSWVAAAEIPSEPVARLGGIGLLAWLLALALRVAVGRARGVELLRLASYLPLFLVAPPLVAFAVFFCVDHSLRHLLEEVARGDAARRLVLEAAPATAATAAGAALLAALWAEGAGAPPTTVRVIFQTLAALTLPHMVLTWADETRARTLAAQRGRGPSR